MVVQRLGCSSQGLRGDGRLRGGEKHEDEDLRGGGEREGPFLAAEFGVPFQELRRELGALDLQHGQESCVGDVSRHLLVLGRELDCDPTGGILDKLGFLGPGLGELLLQDLLEHGIGFAKDGAVFLDSRSTLGMMDLDPLAFSVPGDPEAFFRGIV